MGACLLVIGAAVVSDASTSPESTIDTKLLLIMPTRTGRIRSIDQQELREQPLLYCAKLKVCKLKLKSSVPTTMT